ncbi:oxygen-binding di-iron domain-containing protein [Petrachloros mirabilis]
MGTVALNELKNSSLNANEAILLFEKDDHKVYWVGTQTAGDEIECNSYVILDGESGYLLEPGGFDRFGPVFRKVCGLISPNAITHLFFSHQDPDICASFPSWTKWNENISLVVSTLWTRFMLHYESRDMSGKAHALNFLKVPDEGASVPLKSGGRLECISAPYLHSPGNILVFDTVSGFLFSGDVGAAMYKDNIFRLVIDDWGTHTQGMQGFHQRYMSSNRAVAGMRRKLDKFKITAILPQHGCIFRNEEVPRFLDWLGRLPVGADYLYPNVA